MNIRHPVRIFSMFKRNSDLIIQYNHYRIYREDLDAPIKSCIHGRAAAPLNKVLAIWIIYSKIIGDHGLGSAPPQNLQARSSYIWLNKE